MQILTTQQSSSLVQSHKIKLFFSNTEVFKGTRFNERNILDIRTHFKPTETFRIHSSLLVNLLALKKGFVKGEALRLSRSNSDREFFETNKHNFKQRLIQRGYPLTLISGGSRWGARGPPPPPPLFLDQTVASWSWRPKKMFLRPPLLI